MQGFLLTEFEKCHKRGLPLIIYFNVKNTLTILRIATGGADSWKTEKWNEAFYLGGIQMWTKPIKLTLPNFLV